MNQKYTLVDKVDLIKESGTLQDDVVGLDSFKKFVSHLIKINADSAVASSKGVKKPRGIIFNGPPGTGKTLVARYTAKALGYNFIYASAAGLIGAFPALSIKNLTRLFDEATSIGDCVLFIDEIDAAVKDRATGGSDGGGFLQKFLELLDGTSNKDRNTHLLVIVATNHIEHLDKAFTRPGRFDEKIYFGLPGRAERKEFITTTIKSDLDIETFVDLTEGLSYAELRAFVDKVFYIAYVNNTEINKSVMLEALQIIISGSSSNADNADPIVAKHSKPHLTGHTLGSIFYLGMFTMGDANEGAFLTCSPKLVKSRVSSRRFYIARIMSILWAMLLEIQILGESSSLSLDELSELTSLLDNLLMLFGCDFSGQLNKNKMKVNLSSLFMTYVSKMNKHPLIIKLKKLILNQYQQGAITREDLKKLINDAGITNDMINNSYNGFINIVNNKLNLKLAYVEPDDQSAKKSNKKNVWKDKASNANKIVNETNKIDTTSENQKL